MGEKTSRDPVNGLHPAPQLAVAAEGGLEQTAREHGVSPLAVVRNLLPDHRTIVPGDNLALILREVSGWGEILLVVHTADFVFEWPTRLAAGALANGRFQFSGESPLGGSIRAENCRHIAFICRPFLERASRSIQFFNGKGDVMFKIFVRRDAQRNLSPEQVEKYDALRARCGRQAAPSSDFVGEKAVPEGEHP